MKPQPDESTIPRRRLWEIDHPYYCSDSNWYVGGVPRRQPAAEDFTPWDHMKFDSWADFGWKDSDADLNLLFRWDWKVPDPEDCEDGGEVPRERLHLYWLLQRKGRFMVVSFPVDRSEEPEIRAWLTDRAAHLRLLWEPLL